MGREGPLRQTVHRRWPTTAHGQMFIKSRLVLVIIVIPPTRFAVHLQQRCAVWFVRPLCLGMHRARGSRAGPGSLGNAAFATCLRLRAPEIMPLGTFMARRWSSAHARARLLIDVPAHRIDEAASTKRYEDGSTKRQQAASMYPMWLLVCIPQRRLLD